MSEQPTQVSTGGIGFFGLLALAFIVLKLTNYINWSWWWVLSPLWLPAFAAVGFILVVLLFAFLADFKK